MRKKGVINRADFKTANFQSLVCLRVSLGRDRVVYPPLHASINDDGKDASWPPPPVRHQRLCDFCNVTQDSGWAWCKRLPLNVLLHQISPPPTTTTTTKFCSSAVLRSKRSVGPLQCPVNQEIRVGRGGGAWGSPDILQNKSISHRMGRT